MKNGDMPTTPLVMDNGHPYHASNICFENSPLTSGLTKREHFAGLAMQSLIGVYWDDHKDGTSTHGSAHDLVKCLSESAIEHADALLKELDK